MQAVRKAVVLLVLACLTSPVLARDLAREFEQLALEYESANFGFADNDTKLRALGAVHSHAVALGRQYPGRAEPICWQGWILMAESNLIPDFGSVQRSHAAIERLEAAVAIDPSVYGGAPFASLGELHVFGSQFPFPLAFGSKERGREYFRKGLQLDPDGLETNARYAKFLFDEKNFAAAFKHANAAMLAPPLKGRPQADRELRDQAEHILKFAFAPN